MNGFMGNIQTVGGQQFAVVLLQRVLVLATGQNTSPDTLDSKDAKDRYYSKSDNLLTLSLTVTEAQLLSLAQQKGRIAVAVRNPEDQRTAASIPDLSSAALFDAKTRPATPHGQGGGGGGGGGGPTEIKESR